MTEPREAVLGRLTVAEAIRAGQRFVNLPLLIMLDGLLCGFLFFRHSLWFFAVVFGGIGLAWIYWAFAVRRWWRWAVGRGVDPIKLQDPAEKVRLIWPRNSFFYRRGGFFGRHDTPPVLPHGDQRL